MSRESATKSTKKSKITSPQNKNSVQFMHTILSKILYSKHTNILYTDNTSRLSLVNIPVNSHHVSTVLRLKVLPMV